MSGPLISIALATYNGERYLREQIDSLLAQAGVRVEIVAVDDASADGTSAILRDYAARDSRIRVFSNDGNRGPLPTFDRAMSLCEGDFIAPSDHDDIWCADKLAKLLAAIGDRDLAYCDSAFIDGEGRASGLRVSDKMPMMSGRAPLRFAFRNSVSGHASLVRRSLLDIARPFPKDVFHDWWLALAAASRNGIVYLDEPLVRFRRHDDAFSRIGRGATRDVPDRSRFWVQQRRTLLGAFARSRLTGHDDAARLFAAFEEAVTNGRRGPLLRELWRLRDGIAERHPATLDAMRLQLRALRKLRGAARESS